MRVTTAQQESISYLLFCFVFYKKGSIHSLHGVQCNPAVSFAETPQWEIELNGVLIPSKSTMFHTCDPTVLVKICTASVSFWPTEGKNLEPFIQILLQYMQN